MPALVCCARQFSKAYEHRDAFRDCLDDRGVCPTALDDSVLEEADETALLQSLDMLMKGDFSLIDNPVDPEFASCHTTGEACCRELCLLLASAPSL